MTATDTVTTPKTTANGSAPTEPATTATSSRTSRIRLVLIALFGLLTIGMLSPAPAQAAAAPAYGTVTICFQVGYTINGVFYTGIYNRPVQVDVWLNGTAQRAQTQIPNTRGCLTTALVPGYYWRFRVYQQEGAYLYFGTSAWQYVLGGGNYNLGTMLVSAIRV